MRRIGTRITNGVSLTVGFAATTAVLGAMVLAGAVAPVAVAAGAHGSVQVVASNLNSPRSLAWGSGGSLLVSEAGLGGSTCFGSGMNKTCVGLTGSISSIKHGAVRRIVKGLFSVGPREVTGPDGLATYGGHVYTVMTASSAVVPPGAPPALAVAAYNQLGRVLDVTPGLRWSMVGDPGDYDYAWANLHKNLTPQNFPDANPYALLVTARVTYVVDAGSNTLDAVYPNGTVQILAFVPNPKAGDAVPTCVAQGKDGALYIGQLTAAGNPAGSANVYRWTAKGGLKVWRTGFSAITGCGFDKKGNFYATELDLTGFPPTGIPAGAVVQVTPKGKRTMLGLGKLFAPNGFLAGPDGSIYVTNWSVQPGTSTHGSPTGQVVRITP
jgi:hypothetical protein